MNEKETVSVKRFRLKVFHVLIILLITGVGAFVYFRLSLKSKLQARIDTIRAAGYPVTCAELDKWYTIPENVENAAHTIIDAFWCYREMGEIESLPLVGRAKLPPRTEPLTEEMKASIAQYISDNNETLSLLHKAAAIERNASSSYCPKVSDNRSESRSVYFVRIKADNFCACDYCISYIGSNGYDFIRSYMGRGDIICLNVIRLYCRGSNHPR